MYTLVPKQLNLALLDSKSHTSNEVILSVVTLALLEDFVTVAPSTI